MEKNRVLNLAQSPSLFEVPGTEAFTLEYHRLYIVQHTYTVGKGHNQRAEMGKCAQSMLEKLSTHPQTVMFCVQSASYRLKLCPTTNGNAPKLALPSKKWKFSGRPFKIFSVVPPTK